MRTLLAFIVSLVLAVGAFALVAVFTHGRVLFFPFFLILGAPLLWRPRKS
ncbi:MAG: hypothetical protein JO165_10190 [Candidatus Eremiobacteraeota bacterium]|nr:hypothetical protein [Candidatus Eremiobacteraeota bacterium]